MPHWPGTKNQCGRDDPLSVILSKIALKSLKNRRFGPPSNYGTLDLFMKSQNYTS